MSIGGGLPYLFTNSIVIKEAKLCKLCKLNNNNTNNNYN